MILSCVAVSSAVGLPSSVDGLHLFQGLGLADGLDHLAQGQLARHALDREPVGVVGRADRRDHRAVAFCMATCWPAHVARRAWPTSALGRQPSAARPPRPGPGAGPGGSSRAPCAGSRAGPGRPWPSPRTPRCGSAARAWPTPAAPASAPAGRSGGGPGPRPEPRRSGPALNCAGSSSRAWLSTAPEPANFDQVAIGLHVGIGLVGTVAPRTRVSMRTSPSP